MSRIEGVQVCRNCGSVLTGPYCAQCGQAEEEGHPPSVKDFVHEALEEFIHFDGKILRSVRALLLEPGRLTREYWDGHVVGWLRPLRIFLIAVAVHLFLASGIGPLDLHVLAERTPTGQIQVFVAPDNSAQVGKNGMRPLPEEVQRELAEQFGHTYSLIRYVSVLGFARVSWLLYRRRNSHFTHHLIAGLHFYSFWYLLSAVTERLTLWNDNFRYLGFASALYLGLSVRRIYHEPRLTAIWKTTVLFTAMLAIELGLAFAAMWYNSRNLSL
jgi:hypothetical protein